MTTAQELPDGYLRTDRDPDHDGPECGACGFEHEFGDAGVLIDSQNSAADICPRCGLRYSTPPENHWDYDDVYVKGGGEYPRYTLPDDEVDRRMPAIAMIDDEEIRAEVRRLTASAPTYFWMRPATNFDYHHPICRETRGLWAHTLMVASVTERLAESYEYREIIPSADHALAAAILHDQRKCGPHAEPKRSSTSDHELLMGEVIRKQSTLPDTIARAVESHMGPWYDGPWPSTPLGELVHNADMTASTANVTAHVHGPVPGELADMGVTEVKE